MLDLLRMCVVFFWCVSLVGLVAVSRYELMVSREVNSSSLPWKRRASVFVRVCVREEVCPSASVRCGQVV